MKNRNLKRIIILSLLFLEVTLVRPLHANESLDFLQSNTWTAEDGLPMNTVMAIAQTPDGYLWFATEAGLVRFDGIRFSVFNSENTGPLTSNMIVDLMVDRNGTLWIATRGSGVVCYKNGVFNILACDDLQQSSEIFCFLESMDSAVWIGSRKGLHRFANGILAGIALPPDISRLNRPVSRLLEDRSGRIWVGTRGAGLARVSQRGRDFGTYPLTSTDIWVTTFYEDRKGNVFVGTAENGLLKYTDDRHTAITQKQGLSTDHIRAIHEDRFGNLWLGTQSGGINIIWERDNRISVFHNPEDFTSGGILCFYVDAEGTLWVGTDGQGLISLRESKVTTYYQKHGLSYHNLYGVFQDRSGRIWTGTKGYGVNYFDNGRFFNMNTRDGLSSNSVVAIAQDVSGAIWLGTLGGGINRLENDKITVFTTENGLSYNFIRAVYVDHEGTVWAGTSKGGIHWFESNRFRLFADVKFRVNILHKDARGDLWAGTLGNGIYRLTASTPGNPPKIANWNTANGLAGNIVSSILEEDDGTLWIGTINGLTRFKNGSPTKLLKKNGLPDDMVYSILQDHRKDFWISSNQGIYRLYHNEVIAFFEGSAATVHPTVFGKESGLRSIECNGGNQPPAWKSRDGKLWYPTTNGLSVVDPQKIGINKIPPPVILEKIISGGRTYRVFGTDSPMTIPPGQDNLEFHFTAPSFIVSEKIRFRYMLEGYDTNGFITDTRRKCTYSGLSPGTYRFTVTACNSDGVWNNTGTWVDIHLEPRFYQTAVFTFGLPTLVFLTILGLYLISRRKRDPSRTKPVRRTSGSYLSPEETETCIQKLFYLMEVEKVYKNSNLAIKSLASMMVVSQRSLSHIINEQLNSNFHEFVNKHRIKEAQKRLTAAGDHQESILDIAYDVGFNSKSAFNRAFKCFTQMTPSQYRKKHKN